MFFRQISDFEENFKFLDRINDILFNVWKDKNADKYKTQSMNQLEMFYRSYVNDMRQKGAEMASLLKEIEGNLNSLEEIGRDLYNMTIDPDIQGCWLGYATGQVSEYSDGGEYFVICRGEDHNDLLSLANLRCEHIYDIEDAYPEVRL